MAARKSPRPKTRSFSLDVIDPNINYHAPLGSAPWSRAVHIMLCEMLDTAKDNLTTFRNLAEVFQEHRGWQQLDDEHGHLFPSFRAFCTATTPYGLGYDPQVIEALVQETREMTLGEKLAEIQALQPHGTNQYSTTGVDVVNSISGVDVVNSTPVQGGNSRDYLLARLKRDSPGTAEALARGEYPSVRAAAKAAGIVQDPTPLTIILRAWAKASAEERAEILQRLHETA